MHSLLPFIDQALLLVQRPLLFLQRTLLLSKRLLLFLERPRKRFGLRQQIMQTLVLPLEGVGGRFHKVCAEIAYVAVELRVGRNEKKRLPRLQLSPGRPSAAHRSSSKYVVTRVY